MSEAELIDFFAPYGKVQSAKVVTDKMTGTSQRKLPIRACANEASCTCSSTWLGLVVTGRLMGYGFVLFETAEQAQAAIAAKNGMLTQRMILIDRHPLTDLSA